MSKSCGFYLLNSSPIRPFLSTPAPSRTCESPSTTIYWNSVLTTVALRCLAPSNLFSEFHQRDLTKAACFLYSHSSVALPFIAFGESSHLLKSTFTWPSPTSPKSTSSPFPTSHLHHHLVLQKQSFHCVSPVKPIESHVFSCGAEISISQPT